VQRGPKQCIPTRTIKKTSISLIAIVVKHTQTLFQQDGDISHWQTTHSHV
jgi:hypothetical protein